MSQADVESLPRLTGALVVEVMIVGGDQRRPLARQVFDDIDSRVALVRDAGRVEEVEGDRPETRGSGSPLSSWLTVAETPIVIRTCRWLIDF